MSSERPVDRSSVGVSTVNLPPRRRLVARPGYAVEPIWRGDSVVVSAARASASDVVIEEKRVGEEVVVDYEKVAVELVDASPLEIMDKALEMFGNEIAIAFRLAVHSLLCYHPFELLCCLSLLSNFDGLELDFDSCLVNA